MSFMITIGNILLLPIKYKLVINKAAACTLVPEAVSILYWEAFEDFCIKSNDLLCITIFEEIGDLLQNLETTREDTCIDGNFSVSGKTN